MSDYLDANGLQRVWGKFKENISSYKEIENVDIASFDDGSNLPLKSLEVAIEPVQSGSGDPSPTNIRPISGWTACNVVRTGENLFDKATITENKIIDSTTGEDFVFYGRFSSDYIKVNPSTDYYASNVIRGAKWYCVFYYDKNKNYLSCGELPSTGDNASGVVTTPSGCNYVRLVGVSTYKDDVSFVVGNQAPSSYSAYNGNTYTINFVDGSSPLTVYGGTLDALSGVLTLTDGFISSYNGETLPSTWISDRDVYAEGTTPTIGAEVCYKLATPQTVQLTPTIINSLQGDNNFFADSGEIIRVEYQPDNIVGELRSEIQSLDYDIFIVNCINNNGSWVTDVTESELRKAVNENKKIFMAYKNSLVPFIEMTSYTSYPNKATFSCADFGQTDLIQNKLELTKTTLEISFSDSSISEDIESLNLQLTV